jgi:RNA polymerase sigma-B factor
VWALHHRYARCHDDGDALAELVEHYRRYAEAQARRLFRNGEPIEDLTQVCYEALVVALQRFDPARGTPFLAFAKPTILGALRRHVRDSGWSVRVPRQVHELASPIRDASELLTHDRARAPSGAEIADFVGVDEGDVRDVRAAERMRATRSLDAPDGTTGLPTEEVVGRTDRALAGVVDRTALHQSLEQSPEADRALLRMYFVDQRSQAEIADRLSCSQMQVSRLLRRAVHRLRRRIVGG